MKAATKSVLQILPHAAGALDGVRDYAITLARGLREHGIAETIFAAQEKQTGDNSFTTVALDEAESLPAKIDGLVLHYVNYGFQKRGVPFSLSHRIEQLRKKFPTRLLIIFHELFASGPPWKSEFWLQPLQKKIARNLSSLADARLVSSRAMRIALKQLAPEAEARVQPVPSAFGEPRLDRSQFVARDPHRWAICGGTQLVERSLRSFLKLTIPEHVAPHELLVLGGTDNPEVRALIDCSRLVASRHGHGDTAPWLQRIDYQPNIAANDASKLLSHCAFAWLDYFTTTNARADTLLKSSTFAGLCAHGIVCATPPLQGSIRSFPFTIQTLPANDRRSDTASAIYDWYHGHASSQLLTRAVAEELQLA